MAVCISPVNIDWVTLNYSLAAELCLTLSGSNSVIYIVEQSVLSTPRCGDGWPTLPVGIGALLNCIIYICAPMLFCITRIYGKLSRLRLCCNLCQNMHVGHKIWLGSTEVFTRIKNVQLLHLGYCLAVFVFYIQFMAMRVLYLLNLQAIYRQGNIFFMSASIGTLAMQIMFRFTGKKISLCKRAVN